MKRLLWAWTLAVVVTDVAQADDLARKGVFGAAFAPVTEAEAKAAEVPVNTAAKVSRVTPGLTAAAIDVKVGDIIVSFAGEAYKGPALIQRFIKRNPSGAPLTVEVLRDAKKVKLSGKLVERPRQKEEGMDVLYTSVTSKGKMIRMIVTSPKGKTANPTLFLIGGIGAYSVDGDFAATAYGNVLGPIARKGYAIVRIDKPGQGDSEGPDYGDLLFDDECDAYLQALKLAKTLPMVDKDRIAIFGHSMGGAFGPLVAAQEKVAGVATYGTMSKTWLEYQLENIRRQSLLAGASATDVDKMMHAQAEVNFYIFGKGMALEDVRKQHPELSEALNEFAPDGKTYSGVGIPFFQQLATKNLPEAWAKAGCDVLAMYGENDFITCEADHRFIADTVNAASPGKGEFQLVPQSDHGFTKTTSQKDSLTNWGKGGTFNPAVIDVLGTWLEKVIGKGA